MLACIAWSWASTAGGSFGECSVSTRIQSKPLRDTISAAMLLLSELQRPICSSRPSGPDEFTRKRRIAELEKFKLDPPHQMPGLDLWQRLHKRAAKISAVPYGLLDKFAVA